MKRKKMIKKLAEVPKWLLLALYYKRYARASRGLISYETLEVLGPEHEFCLVDSELKPLPIVEEVINEYYTKLASFLYLPNSAFRKEFPSQIVELKARKPFKSPELLEETMQKAILSFLDFLKKKYDAQLLGTGMHPLLGLEETSVREHDIIAQELGKVFPLKRHGWLNIQSFQINLPYSSEQEAVTLYNMLAQLCTYLPAISAASPICEGQLTPYDDFRLVSYKSKSVEFPSVTGDVIPEYISSFSQFEKEVSDVYSRDLTNAGVSVGDFEEYVNQRGLVFKFKRNALEVRVIDEQECIRSDVALSCFVRSAIRGLTASDNDVLPHQVLVNDYNSIVKDGLGAETLNPLGKDAKHICQYFLNLAYKYADENEKRYLWIIQKRINEGNLSKLIRKRVQNRAQKTTLKEAIISIYSKLAECVSKNQPYF